MDEYDFGSRAKSQKRSLPRNCNGKIQYLLSSEVELLQSISARAPLTDVLNKICNALDYDIGNMVSLISLRDDDAADLADVASSAKHFGLYGFCSARVIGENDELLGSLEMYCCFPRSPSIEEFQLIERAACLAAIAIKRDKDAGDNGNFGTHGRWSLPGCVFQWPVSTN